MKKIVCVHLLNDYSGSPKVLSQVISASHSAGCEVDLYTGSGEEGFLSGLTDNHYFYFYRFFKNRYLTLVSYLISQVSLFLKLLKYRNQNVIFYVNTLLPFGASLAGKATGNTVYYHVHEISQKPPLLKRFLRFVVQHTAGKVVFVSRSVEASETFPGIPHRVVHNALPEEFIQLASQCSFEWKSGGVFSVLMICSLKPYKGVEEFLQIARLCRASSAVAFTLVVSSDSAELQRYFSGTDVPSNVTLVPRQSDVTPFYRQASVLLNLSRVDEWVETFGLTIVEAMSFGIPVIVPPVGGPTEMVSESVEGYLVSSCEVEEIARLILGLSEDEEKTLELSKNARTRSRDFSQQKFDREILEFIGD
ncbi:MAG: glycosyl transferase family 1 [Gammaproteobacteria bacterium]|nr:MAG: glycosyl transferase family 1 [Gammaproteobacteria bacterium]